MTKELISIPQIIKKNSTAKTKFIELAELLADEGILSKLDQNILTQYCIAWSTYKKAVDELSKGELVIEDKQGIRQNPLYTILTKQSELLIKLGKELGLSPYSRKLIESQIQKPEKDELEEYEKEYEVKSEEVNE